MSPAEIGSRVTDQMYIFGLRRRYRSPPAALPDEPPGSSKSPEFKVGALRFDYTGIAQDFPNLLEGRLHYGGGEWQFEDDARSWHQEHTTLRHWPQMYFNSVDYRPGNATGDARRTWEPGRLQQLIPLSMRLRDTKPKAADEDERNAVADMAVALVERQLISWWTHNPYLHGIHYVSAMECGLRCIAVSHAAALLESSGKLNARVRAIVLSILEQHAGFIRRRISSHSSAGNHTLAECAGLIYANTILSNDKKNDADLEFATLLFTQELDRQVRADGGGLEQATWYHRFNVELAEGVEAILRANELAVPETLSAAIRRGGVYLKALIDCSLEFPKIGDADDGYALGPYYLGQWRDLPSGESVQHFQDSGVSCIRQFGWKIIVQHGPLGMPPSFGHGHADALSLVVAVDDKEVLCDSGTGAYSGELSEQRAGFRSSANHNTVQIGQRDFSKVLGPFMWSHPYTCELRHRATTDQSTELWLELNVTINPVYTVWRYLCLEQNSLVIVDRVKCESAENVTQRWHTPMVVRSAKLNEWCWLGSYDTEIMIELDGGSSTSSVSSKRSKNYGELEAVTILSQTQPVDNVALMSMKVSRNQQLSEAVGDVKWRASDALKDRSQEFFK